MLLISRRELVRCAKIGSLTIDTDRFQDYAASGFASVTVVPYSATVIAANPAAYPTFLKGYLYFTYSGVATGSTASYTTTLKRGSVIINQQSGGFSGNGTSTKLVTIDQSDGFAGVNQDYTLSFTMAGGGGAEGGSIFFNSGTLSVTFIKK